MAQQPTGNVSAVVSADTHNNESDKNGNNGNDVVICTICIDPVIETRPRAVVRLGCGHRFHLDCIGSEFNARGIMRCPNCRVIEEGEWRFSNGQCPQNTNENQAQFFVEAPAAVLLWCPILGPFTYGPSRYGPYEVCGIEGRKRKKIFVEALVQTPLNLRPFQWGLPSHGYGPAFSHQWNLLPLPSNAPAQCFPAIGLPTINGSWGTFTPSANSCWANRTVPSLMRLSSVAPGEVPSLQSVTEPFILHHGSGAFGPSVSSISSPMVYTAASPPAHPSHFLHGSSLRFRLAQSDSMASSSNSDRP